MASTFLCALALTLLTVSSTALHAQSGAKSRGQIYGQVWVSETGTPAAGAEVEATCGDRRLGPVAVDTYGTYRILEVPISSTCRLRVRFMDRNSLQTTVRVMDPRVHANLELRPWQGNQWLLLRR